MKINYLYLLLLPLCASAQVQTLKGNGQPVMQMRFGQDPKELFVQYGKPFNKTYGSTPTYYVWNWENQQRTELFSEQITQLSPNGQFIARVRVNQIEILDRKIQKITHTIPIEALSGLHLSFTEDNHSLLVQNNQGFSLFDLEQAKFIRHWQRFGDTKFVLSDAFWVQSEGDSLRLQDFRTQKWLKTLSIPDKEQLKNISFSPELFFFVTHSDQYLRLWEAFTPALVSKKCMKPVQIDKNEHFWGICPMGKYLLFGKDTLKLCIMSSDKIIVTPLAFEHPITNVTWSEHRLAAGDQQGNVKIWIATDEAMSQLIYQKEMERETHLRLFSCKNCEGIAHEKRKLNAHRAICNKYLQIYAEEVLTKQTPQEMFLNYLDSEEIQKYHLEQIEMERKLRDKQK